MFEYRGHCIVREVTKTYELNFRCLVIHVMVIEVKGLQYEVLLEVRLSGTQTVPDGCYEVPRYPRREIFSLFSTV